MALVPGGTGADDDHAAAVRRRRPRSGSCPRRGARRRSPGCLRSPTIVPDLRCRRRARPPSTRFCPSRIRPVRRDSPVVELVPVDAAGRAEARCSNRRVSSLETTATGIPPACLTSWIAMRARGRQTHPRPGPRRPPARCCLPSRTASGRPWCPTRCWRRRLLPGQMLGLRHALVRLRRR